MSNPLLRYSLTPAPFPLRVSSPGDTDIAVLTLVATNPVATTALIVGVEVQLPGDLCAANQRANIAPVPKTKGWEYSQKDSDKSKGKFLFLPTTPPFKVPISEQLEFLFQNVKVSTEPGLSKVRVTEWSGRKKPPKQASVELPLTKFPTGWKGDVQFWATNPNLPYPGEAELNWSGPAGATYSLEYSTLETGVVNVPGPHGKALGHRGKYPPPPKGFTGPTGFPLQKTTIFTLNVQETIDGKKYRAPRQITVTVAPKPVPPPKITQFTGKFVSRGGADQLLLSWKTENTQYCKLTGSTDELQPSGEDHKITPTASSPLLTTYTLDAVGAKGPKGRPKPARKTLEVVWGTDAPGSPVQVGSEPAELAVSPNGKRVYVTDSTTPFSAFDAHTLERLEKSPLSLPLLGSVAVSPDGKTVFANSTEDPSSLKYHVTAFGAKTLEVIRTSSVVAVGALAVSPDAKRVYAAGHKPLVPRHQAQLRTWVSALNAETLKEEKRSPVWKGESAGAVVASPDGKKVFVVTVGTTKFRVRVKALDAETLKQVGHSPDIAERDAPGPSIELGVSPDGGRIFVTHPGQEKVTVLQSDSLEPAPHSPAKVGKSPSGVAFSPHGARVFVINWADHTMTVLDADSLEPAAHSPVGVGEHPAAVAASPDGARVFVTNYNAGTLRALVPLEELREARG